MVIMHFQPSSFAPVFWATLALLGAVVFGYFYWQAHYRLDLSLGLLLSVAFFGLLVFAYCFYEFFKNLMQIE